MIREFRNRFAYIDVAKALAIFTVILGHAVTMDSDVFAFLFAFHMPAFFFFSGYCMKAHFTERISFCSYAKKKMRALLVPYTIFVVYGLILAVLFSADWWNKKGFSYNLQKYLYYAQPTSVGAVWFLICMLIASFITYGAVWAADVLAEGKGDDFEDGTILLEILLLAGLGTILIPRLDVPYHHRLPWKIDSAVTAASFQLLGYLAEKRKILEKMPKALRLAGLVILPLMVWHLAVQKNGYVNVCDIRYGENILYFYAAALAGTLWLLDLGWLLQNLQGLVWLGKNSLVIFGIHTFPLWICTEIYSKVTGVHSYYVDDLFWAVVISLITYAVCAVFTFGWNKTLLHRKIRTFMMHRAPDPNASKKALQF